jgi:integrase
MKRRKKQYPNLHQWKDRPNWVFRKFSSTKGREFVVSTGVEAKLSLRSQAYERGLELYNEWLGSHLPDGKQIFMRDLLRAVVAAKLGKAERTYKTARNQENHLVPLVGYLRPDQVTTTVWETIISKERAAGRDRQFFNMRKLLMEALRRAHEEGYIRSLPRLPLSDKKPDPPKAMTFGDYQRIRNALPWPVKLLAFIMYYQGPRPGEALQYEWTMIRREANGNDVLLIPGSITKTGRSRVIPLNSRVQRALRWLRPRSASDWIFPSRTESKPLTNYNAVWDRAMAKLGLDYTIYNLRDTFISNALDRGTSPVFVAKYCDTSVQMIDSKYAVARSDAMRKVAG